MARKGGKREQATPTPTPEGAAQGPSPEEVEALISDDAIPPVEPKAEVKPEAKADEVPPAAEEKPAEEQPPEEKPAEAPPVEPVAEKRYRVKTAEGHKELTAGELAEQGILEDLIQTREQHPHLTQLHQRLVDDHKELQERVKSLETPPVKEEAPVVTQAQVRATYQEDVDRAVKAGYIEQDFGELYPDTVSQMMYHRNLLYDVRQAVSELQSEVRGSKQRDQGKSVETELNGHLDALAKKDELFKGLGDAEVRKGYVEFLANDVGARIDQMTPEFLGKMWIAYNSDAIAEVKKQAAVTKEKEAEDLRLSAGVGGGARPGGREKPSTDPGADLLVGTPLER
ncbi:hypothetical protein LCGC14_1520510 [marine sediment metagenome]|uniref:Uncharacterized protein n=1 Tax=marine sediment metagenome TaxID=412755 RepID=A0A0F9IYZ2_9ZZZZ